MPQTPREQGRRINTVWVPDQQDRVDSNQSTQSPKYLEWQPRQDTDGRYRVAVISRITVGPPDGIQTGRVKEDLGTGLITRWETQSRDLHVVPM